MDEIERGIPIPPVKCGRKPQHPFNEMEIGESFWTAVAVTTGRWGYDNGRKFVRRKEVKDGVAGIRVWRVA